MSTYQPDEWGLTPLLQQRLEDELADHIACIEHERGPQAAEAARRRVNTPRVRRRLAGPHFVDQVVATLNRRPSLRELQELWWLLLWFALILAADLLSVYSATQAPNPGLRPQVIGDSAAGLAWSAWLAQAAARAGFFSSFLLSLLRAWRIGAGVCLARIIQLKLIHTILVLLALRTVGPLTFSHYQIRELMTDWSPFLNSVLISAILVLAAFVVWLLTQRRHTWILLSAVLMGFFMTPGGPHPYRQELISRPIISEQYYTRYVLRGGRETRQELIESLLPDVRRARIDIDIPSNRVTVQRILPITMPLTRYSNGGWKPDVTRAGVVIPRNYAKVGPDERVLSSHTVLFTPLYSPQAGVGWLAAPIPILGIIGLLAMTMLLGRRGPLEWFLYTIISFVGILLAIIPFWYSLMLDDLPSVSAFSVIGNPFPDCMVLLGLRETDNDLLMMLGLLCSAGIPWLLTALFLRPQAPAAAAPPDEMELAG